MPDNLALRMRPRTIDQVIGQQHLVGEGKIIRRMVEANRLSSMILYGPPGIGKPVLLLRSQERPSMLFVPLMQQLTVKTPPRNRRGGQIFWWLGPAFGRDPSPR